MYITPFNNSVLQKIFDGQFSRNKFSVICFSLRIKIDCWEQLFTDAGQNVSFLCAAVNVNYCASYMCLCIYICCNIGRSNNRSEDGTSGLDLLTVGFFDIINESGLNKYVISHEFEGVCWFDNTTLNSRCRSQLPLFPQCPTEFGPTVLFFFSKTVRMGLFCFYNYFMSESSYFLNFWTWMGACLRFFRFLNSF